MPVKMRQSCRRVKGRSCRRCTVPRAIESDRFLARPRWLRRHARLRGTGAAGATGFLTKQTCRVSSPSGPTRQAVSSWEMPKVGINGSSRWDRLHGVACNRTRRSRVPEDLTRLSLPEGVDRRLQALLDSTRHPRRRLSRFPPCGLHSGWAGKRRAGKQPTPHTARLRRSVPGKTDAAGSCLRLRSRDLGRPR